MATLMVKSGIAGAVTRVEVVVGAQVAEDDVLVLLESMKMEIPVVAPRAGRVAAVQASEGDAIAEDDVLIVLET